jgi:glutamate 5-kinase
MASESTTNIQPTKVLTTTKVLVNAKRWVVKVGSSLVTNDGKGLDQSAIDRWANEIAALRAAGAQVVLVSSGAIAEGMLRLGFAARPTAINELQACAAVGQMGLVQSYESNFSKLGLKTAQVLLTHAVIAT